MPHKTKRIRINGIGRVRYADVDVGIIEVVRWLNSYPGIETDYSCQGGRFRRMKEPPYVSFFCNKIEDLRAVAKICAPSRNYRTTKAGQLFSIPIHLMVTDTGMYDHSHLVGVRAVLSFDDRKAVKSFVRAIGDKKEEDNADP